MTSVQDHSSPSERVPNQVLLQETVVCKSITPARSSPVGRRNLGTESSTIRLESKRKALVDVVLRRESNTVAES